MLNYYICCISVLCDLKYCNFGNRQSVHGFSSVISFSPLFRKLLTFRIHMCVSVYICQVCLCMSAYLYVYTYAYVYFQLFRFCLVSEKGWHYGFRNQKSVRKEMLCFKDSAPKIFYKQREIFIIEMCVS